MEKTKYLLNQVGSLLKSYDKLAKSTGENFNIFSVMGMERDEVKTHSSIIAELLNPKGSHSQGSVFLKIFFQEIESLNEIPNFDFDNAVVKVEEYIGPINKEYTEGGYIDITIKDKTNQIVIENKIDALDQKGQLFRYKNYYKECKLIYLTKNGKSPDKISYYLDAKNNINIEEVILVCYKNKISTWIEKCHKEAIHQPMLRELLKQYSNLLKKLTNQTINNELKMDISELIKSNFLESSQIANNFWEVEKEIITDFFSDVAKAFNQSDKNTDWEMTPKANESNQYFIKNKNWSNVTLAVWIKSKVVYYGVKSLNAKLKNDEIRPIIGNYKTSPNSLLWNDGFVVRLNTTQDIAELINDKDKKVKMAFDFIGDMTTKLEKYCAEADKIVIEKNLKSF
jgi:hypothetical protein